MNLVTGATGLLGTHLMMELLSRGERVRALVRPLANRTAVEDVFRFCSNKHFESIEWIEGDVLDIDSLQEAMQGCSHVFHCAAIVSYHEADRAEMYRVNTEGTANLINVALHLGNVKVGFVSSIAAIGKAKNNEHVDEESEWVENDMNTHYAITKQLSEMEFWRGLHEGLEGVAFNCGFIIGPGSFERSSPSLFRKLNEGMSFYPPGGTGFIAVSDAAKCIAELTLGKTTHERFILVTENRSMKEVFQLVAKSLGVRVPTHEAKPWILQLARIAEWIKEKMTGRKALVTRETVKNASLRFYYDASKMQGATGLEATPISEAIEQTAAYFKQSNYFRN
jgi:nucleoside-diphosphate-sugar epimerase